MAGKTYESKYQGQAGIYKAGSGKGQIYKGKSASARGTPFLSHTIDDKLKRLSKNIAKIFN